MATIAVHVTPTAGRDEVVGWRGNELLVRVTVAPEGGKANAAVCKTIASAMGVPKTSVHIVRGDVSRHKIVEVVGASEQDVADAFGGPEAALF
jgi:uncharacterized protein (TIGR00251 family)